MLNLPGHGVKEEAARILQVELAHAGYRVLVC